MRHRFTLACENFGMKISLSKTIPSRLFATCFRQFYLVDQCRQILKSRQHLCTSVNTYNNLTITYRIGKASTTCKQFRVRLWDSHHLTIKLKIKVDTARLVSTLCVAANLGALMDIESGVLTFYMQMLAFNAAHISEQSRAKFLHLEQH